MNKKLTFQLVLILVLLTTMPGGCVKKEVKKQTESPKISNPINLEEGEKIINTFFKDIMRKDEISRIDLVAKQNLFPFCYDLCLLIDGHRHPLDKKFQGYSPSLSLSDFDNDGLMDFLISIHSGKTDSSLLIQMFHFKQRKMISFIPNNLEQGLIPLQLSWKSIDKVQILSKTHPINITKKVNLVKQEFLQKELGITPYQKVEIKDLDRDGQAEIVTKQSIWVGFPHMTIFQFISVLKFSQDRWNILEYQINPVSH